MIQNLIANLTLLGLLAGCGGPFANEEASGGVGAESSTKPERPSPNLVTLTEAEAQLAGIATDTLTLRAVVGTLRVSGILDVPPEQLISIHAPLGGLIERTTLLQGTHVHAGDALATLRNPAFIELQEQYLEVQGRLRYAAADRARQRELVDEEVAPLKNLQRAQAEYEALAAQAAGLRARLAMAGLPAGRTPLATTAVLRAPKDGYVKEVHVTVGQTVGPMEPLFQLVDPTHLHVELTVFEKDVPLLRPGQRIRFALPGDSAAERGARIYLIGRSVDPGLGTVRIHGHPDNEDDPALLPGMFVKAVIETDSRRVPALPEGAVMTYEGKAYVFVQLAPRRYGLRQVHTGQAADGYTEITAGLEGLPHKAQVVTRGAYTLLGKLKNVGED